MKQLSIRHKLYLLVGLSLGSIVFVGGLAWWSVQTLGGSLDTIGSRNLPAIMALTALRASRFELAKAMQDGVAYRPDQYQDLASQDDAVEEARALFGEILEIAQNADAAGEKAFGTYDKLPKSADENALWDEVKSVWNEYRELDQRQIGAARFLSAIQDWDNMTRTHSIFVSNTIHWANGVDRLAPMLKRLSALNLEAVEVAQASGRDTIARTRIMLALTVAIIILLSLVLGVLVARSIVKVLHELRATITLVAENNDFTRSVAYSGNDETAQTAAAFNILLQNVRQSLQQVVCTAASVADAAREALSASNEVAQAASEQSESAIAMASMIEQTTAGITQLASNSEDAAQYAFQASAGAEQGASRVRQAAAEIDLLAKEIAVAGTTVSELGRDSGRISKVVDVIKGLAEQTNLLALNAAIEAARAGEQGRGFAVVADEVRKLAERTTSSAHEIGEMVNLIQNSASAAVRQVADVVARAQDGRVLSEQASETIDRIRDEVRHVTSLVGAISASLTDQTRAALDISNRVEVISRMSETARSAGLRTAAVSEAMGRASNELQESVECFTV